MSKVGFGGYRISIRSDYHYQCLTKALKEGCSIIDTSANYTDGESEQLIGKVLKDTGLKPLLISKAGYIQGKNLEEVMADATLQMEMVDFAEDMKHSIHPVFLQNQIEKSLKRLAVDCIDVYLLHNPEYYLKTEGSSKEEYYSRIQKAFLFLEDKVKEGKIKSYGISSNTFIHPKEEHEATDFSTILNIVKDNNFTHFNYIQFPMNLLELGALERQFDGLHIIEKAQENGIKTIINRPLNAITEQGLLRLANYHVASEHTDEFAQKQFNKLIQPLVKKWDQEKEEGDESIFELPFMQHFTSLWNKQNSPDAVDHLFMGYFFPFVAQVWGGDLSVEESQSFYDLYDLAIVYARKNMNDRANTFKKQAIDKGLLFESEMCLSKMAIEKYQTFGVDIILVGMKNTEYVDKMKEYF
jgi:aryl-alcohol dehydrogenase-like predicted oxidoreductase